MLKLNLKKNTNNIALHRHNKQQIVIGTLGNYYKTQNGLYGECFYPVFITQGHNS